MSSDTDSPLSDAPSDLEDQIHVKKQRGGILKFFTPTTKKPKQPKKPSTPPPIKRSMTPPHEPVLSDHEAIAFIVMFRSRFSEVFPKSLANFGPQEIERGVVDTVPSEQVEDLLCALLGLLLNRKQDVKRGHYNRALEESIQTHKLEWPKVWQTKNPLLGNTTFISMSPDQRLTLLRTLIMWSLTSSEAVKKLIADSYKQVRRADDINQPLSVQPWGSDGHKRRYFLIEGQDDTHFRVYRESNLEKSELQWTSMAGDIEELKGLAEKLIRDDNTKEAKILSGKILNAIPRFEATEEKRRRREYRQVRRQQFSRPSEPAFSMYEGRTRGKRMKYTFSDLEEDIDLETATRRSTRNTRNHTPAEAGPTITQSGRQVKTRQGGTYGESMLSETHDPVVDMLDETLSDDNDDEVIGRRPRRAAAAAAAAGAVNQNGKRPRGYNPVEDMDDDDDASEQDYGEDDEEEDEEVPVESDVEDPISDEDENMEDEDGDETQQSLIVKLPIKTATPEKKPNGIKLKLKLNSAAKQDVGPQNIAKDPPTPSSMPSENTAADSTSASNLAGSFSMSTIPTKNVAMPIPSARTSQSYVLPQRVSNGYSPPAIDVGSHGA